MTDTLTRAARALAIAQSGVDEWDALDEAFQDNLRGHVRAVLEAIREPSEGMVREGMTNLPSVSPFAYGTMAPKAAATWRAMIDAALSE